MVSQVVRGRREGRGIVRMWVGDDGDDYMYMS